MSSTKFIHIADIHLGSTQYNLFERFKDFNRAFRAILNKALEEEVDFILLAGDMFNSNKINPDTISAIHSIISEFKQKCTDKLSTQIPIIAIEGNHDKSTYFSKRSWMKFLADLDLIILLEGQYDKKKNKMIFNPYSEEKRRGGYITINDINIYGVPYFGAFTPKLFPLIQESIGKKSSKYNILMMHFGISGQDRDKIGFQYNKSLDHLHKKVDYLALGHFHRMYKYPITKPWIFNPGSLEINGPGEIWGMKGFSNDRGAFLIEINPSNPELNQYKQIICYNGESQSKNQISNRFFYQVNINFNEDLNPLASFEELVPYVIDYLKVQGLSLRNDGISLDLSDLNVPFVFISLFGKISFSKLDFNLKFLQNEIMTKYAILGVKIFSGSLQSLIDGVNIDSKSERTLADIEKEVFTQIIESNKEYSSYSQDIVNIMRDLKSPLLEPNPDIEALMDKIEDWWRSNIQSKTQIEHIKDSTINSNNIPIDEKPENKDEYNIHSKTNDGDTLDDENLLDYDLEEDL